MIDEVKLTCRVDGCTRDGEETIFRSLHLCPGSQYCGCIRQRGLRRICWNIKHRELTLANFKMMRYVFDGVFVGKLAEAQEGAATVVVADAVAALRVYVNIAEVNVRRVVDAGGRGERRAGARDPICGV